MVKRWFVLVLALLVVMATQIPQTAAAQETFPDEIDLPNGWLPEGIATGVATLLYSGSRVNGAIYQADLRTGEGEILVPGQEGRVAVGLKHDPRTNYLYVAGGPTGDAYIFDADDGSDVAVLTLTTESATFINDVVVTRDAAYFTDSQRAVLYQVPLSANGDPGDTPVVQELPLSGDWQQVPGFNANGIDATKNGKYLIVVNSTLGTLYRVDADTGEAVEIDLGGATVVNGDGLLLRGKTLYVVQNQFNQVAVVELNQKFTRGEVVDTITNPNLDVPTTIAAHGNSLYVVNARFTTPPTPDTEYTIVKIK